MQDVLQPDLASGDLFDLDGAADGEVATDKPMLNGLGFDAKVSRKFALGAEVLY